MAVYARGSNTTSTNNSQSSLPSVDLSSIIVKSLETTLNNTDDRDKSGNITNAIRDGINSSVLGKNTGNNNAIKNENELQKLKKKNNDEDHKMLKKMFSTLGDHIKTIGKTTSHLEKDFNQAFKTVTDFTQNPLVAFDKGLQGIVKGTLGTIDKIKNTEISIGKDKKDEDKEKNKEAFTPLIDSTNNNFSKVEAVLNQIQVNTGSSKDDSGKEKDRANKKEQKEEKEREKDRKEGVVREKKRSEDADKMNEGIAKTNLTLGGIGKIIFGVVAIIAAGWALLPPALSKITEFGLSIKEKVTNFFSNLPAYIENLKASFGLLVEELVVKLKTEFMPIIDKLAVKFLTFGKRGKEKAQILADYYGVSEEEAENYAENEKLVNAYTKYQEYKKKEDEARQRLELLEDQNSGEALKLKNTIEHNEKQRKALSRKSYQYVDPTTGKSETVFGTSFIGGISAGNLSEGAVRAIETSQIMSGDSEARTKKLNEELEAKRKSVKATQQDTLRHSQFATFMKSPTLGMLQEVVDTGSWHTEHYGKGEGDKYVATADEMNAVKEAISKGNYRDLSKAENIVISGAAVGQSEANVFKTIQKVGWDSSTKIEDPYKVDAGFGQYTVTNVTQNRFESAGTMSGKGH